jgi:hypothetical protein
MLATAVSTFQGWPRRGSSGSDLELAKSLDGSLDAFDGLSKLPRRLW